MSLSDARQKPFLQAGIVAFFGRTDVDEIADLRLFTAIVSAGSLSEAARRTHGSLSATSRRLAQLEARLGAKLIDRGSRHFVLTQEGHVLHESALQIINLIDETEAEIVEGVRSPRGHLRIGAPHEIGRRRVSKMLAEFSQRHRDISIELVLTDTNLEELDHEVDLGLHVDFPKKSNTVVRKLLTSRRVLCAAPDFLKRYGTPQTVSDLSRFTCIKLTRVHSTHDPWLYKSGDLIREHSVVAALATNCSDVMHEWAVAGYGLAMKALWDIEDDLKAGRLIAVLEKEFCMELPLFVTYPQANRLPARTRMVIDYLADGLSRPTDKTAPCN